MLLYLNYKVYYDRKTKVAPLETGDYCFILQLLADHQSSKIPFQWIGLYVLEKVLPNETYIVGKLIFNRTHFEHHIRLRKYKPKTTVQDIRLEGNLQADDESFTPQDDL